MTGFAAPFVRSALTASPLDLSSGRSRASPPPTLAFVACYSAGGVGGEFVWESSARQRPLAAPSDDHHHLSLASTMAALADSNHDLDPSPIPVHPPPPLPSFPSAGPRSHQRTPAAHTLMLDDGCSLPTPDYLRLRDSVLSMAATRPLVRVAGEFVDSLGWEQYITSDDDYYSGIDTHRLQLYIHI
ncbi:hypothetical protein C8F01DRAFT_1373397 [Mycena amicta]|nr:hypothetical protein C8F01DRAFT_1373397 [Mycena amicta]